jgi:hypothetical protein
LSTVKRDRISIEIEEGIETNTLLHYIWLPAGCC